MVLFSLKRSLFDIWSEIQIETGFIWYLIRNPAKVCRNLAKPWLLLSTFFSIPLGLVKGKSWIQEKIKSKIKNQRGLFEHGSIAFLAFCYCWQIEYSSNFQFLFLHFPAKVKLADQQTIADKLVAIIHNSNTAPNVIMVVIIIMVVLFIIVIRVIKLVDNHS